MIQVAMVSKIPRAGHPGLAHYTYLSFVSWADIEVVDDSGDTRLEIKLGVGCPKI